MTITLAKERENTEEVDTVPGEPRITADEDHTDGALRTKAVSAGAREGQREGDVTHLQQVLDDHALRKAVELYDCIGDGLRTW